MNKYGYNDWRNYLMHYNHNHDALGRFASSSTSFASYVDKELKKGQNFQRITNTPNELNKGRTYVSYLDSDNNLYKDTAKDLLLGNIVTQLKLIKNAKIAGASAMKSAFVPIYKKYTPRELSEASLPFEPKEPRAYTKARKEYYKIYKKAHRSQKKFDKAFERFISDLNRDNEITREYFNILKNKGYDAAYDFNDISNGGLIEPIIFFDRKKNLKLQKTTFIND